MRIATRICIVYFRCMDQDSAIGSLAALAHPTRLSTFRLLIRHEPEGLSTGELAEKLALSQSTFSTHLAVLAKAGLVQSDKQGRHFIQRARIDALRELMTFLAKDCCQGRAELCEPLVAELATC
jgi:ArsR family transcriptional regulator, arsenate/arsenite/antimonite-responsive transcriptional repressor